MGAGGSCCQGAGEDERMVTKIDLSHCGCTEVPPIVFQAERYVENLNLAHNRILSLPPQLFHCQELKHLNLVDNGLDSLPPAIGSLLHLVSLKLDKNCIKDLPDNIKMCRKLKRLSLSNNQLQQLPGIITQLISLEELYMNDCDLSFLPASVGRLTKIRILELRNNRLCNLPLSMSRMTSISRLDLGDNSFETLPECSSSLTSLHELLLDNNDLETMSGAGLKKLHHLDVSYNNLRSIAKDIGQCTSLTFLNLGWNYIETLPDTVSNLTQLEILVLEMNELSTLPRSLGKVSHLEELNVSNNRLCDLPPTLGLLRHLTVLNFSRNYVQELPCEIGSCSRLSIMNASYNRLQSLPAEVGYLNKLKVLDLVGNFLMYLPISMSNLTGVRAIWLSANQNVPLIPFTEDVSMASGERFLTNIALPQLGETALPPVENTEPVEKTTWRRKIRFEEDGDLLPGRLDRTPTPFPKELRCPARKATRADDNYVNVVDGRVAVFQQAQSPPSATTYYDSNVTVIREANIRRNNNDKNDAENIVYDNENNKSLEPVYGSRYNTNAQQHETERLTRLEEDEGEYRYEKNAQREESERGYHEQANTMNHEREESTEKHESDSQMHEKLEEDKEYHNIEQREVDDKLREEEDGLRKSNGGERTKRGSLSSERSISLDLPQNFVEKNYAQDEMADRSEYKSERISDNPEPTYVNRADRLDNGRMSPIREEPSRTNEQLSEHLQNNNVENGTLRSEANVAENCMDNMNGRDARKLEAADSVDAASIDSFESERRRSLADTMDNRGRQQEVHVNQKQVIYSNLRNGNLYQFDSRGYQNPGYFTPPRPATHRGENVDSNVPYRNMPGYSDGAPHIASDGSQRRNFTPNGNGPDLLAHQSPYGTVRQSPHFMNVPNATVRQSPHFNEAGSVTLKQSPQFSEANNGTVRQSPHFNDTNNSTPYGTVRQSPQLHDASNGSSYGTVRQSPQFHEVNNATPYGTVRQSPHFNEVPNATPYGTVRQSPHFNDGTNATPYGTVRQSPHFNGPSNSTPYGIVRQNSHYSEQTPYSQNSQFTDRQSPYTSINQHPYGTIRQSPHHFENGNHVPEMDRPPSKQEMLSIAERNRSQNISPPCYEIAKMYSTKAALFENYHRQGQT